MKIDLEPRMKEQLSCKTSGASSFRIYVLMGAKYTYEQIRGFAEILAFAGPSMIAVDYFVRAQLG